jgi:hypothetical protein
MFPLSCEKEVADSLEREDAHIGRAFVQDMPDIKRDTDILRKHDLYAKTR